jgi:hypothetical protein
VFLGSAGIVIFPFFFYLPVSFLAFLPGACFVRLPLANSPPRDEKDGGGTRHPLRWSAVSHDQKPTCVVPGTHHGRPRTDPCNLLAPVLYPDTFEDVAGRTVAPEQILGPGPGRVMSGKTAG